MLSHVKAFHEEKHKIKKTYARLERAQEPPSIKHLLRLIELVSPAMNTRYCLRYFLGAQPTFHIISKTRLPEVSAKIIALSVRNFQKIF